MPHFMKNFNAFGIYYSSQILKKSIVMRGQRTTNPVKKHFKNQKRAIPFMVS